jgi:uncharacterized protein (TIGR02147 family)
MHMQSVYLYTDYRKYLADWYEEKKTGNSGFSYRVFARKAGFSDKGYFHSVIHAKRNLAKQSIIKISRAIGHSKAESEYFENLVFYNQETDPNERTYFFEKLNGVRITEKKGAEAQQMRKDQYEFYSKWHHSAIRSLIDMYPFNGDYQWLANSVYPAISPREARQSVQLLEKLGIIEKTKTGTYKLTSKSITTGADLVGLAVLNFHREATDLAKNALASIPADKRNITGLTLGLSEKTYKHICEEIARFRSTIVKIVEQDEEADRTYQLNFHFFPITSTELKLRGNA